MVYTCEICKREYKYRKNLLRHMKEKHVIEYEFWNCVVKNCASKFIRREYLFKHLEQIHKFPVDDARKAALKATRGDDVENGYYEEVSDDDTILDLIGEIHDVNSVKKFSVEEFIEEFEKQQGKEQEDIQINENNNYVEDEIIYISSDEEITNEERGLDVSKMKTVMITRTVQILNGHEVGSHVEVETSYYEHSC